MSRRRKRNLDSEDKAEIDLTPMLDVVFIMLIFFIVTASFIKEKSIGVNVPEDNNQEQISEESNSILIQVDGADTIFIDGRRVDVRAVRSLIAQKKAEDPEAPVVVRMHEQATAEMYISIADAARESKIFNVSLVPYKD